ncbi:MAG: Stp1/IreP family PP2C-type Ser/Thr phosphatase [Anaerolineae bacterium]|nr:Stp1/IreP family PP2C-type Ser/Thr phosphatase [Anaerolineae bacterium]
MDLFRRIFSQSEPKAVPVSGTSAGSDETSPVEEKVTDTLPSLSDSPTPDHTLPVAPPSSVFDGATRPLPPETVISSSNEHLTFGQATDVGMVRTNNQDAVCSLVMTSRSSQQRPDFGLFIVADGMGGHHDGEKASALTANQVASYIMHNVFLPMMNGENDVDRVPITEAMIAAVQKANSDVIAKVPDGGTTLTAVAVVGDLAYVVHVGDSRVYLINKDGIEQITRDHSLVQRLIELDQLTREEANVHPQKNVLYRALGQSDHLEVDALTRRLPPNARLMLCSDGLWNMVNEQDIIEITTKYSNPQEACDKLVALANMQGGTDNITAVLLRIPSH